MSAGRESTHIDGDDICNVLGGKDELPAPSALSPMEGLKNLVETSLENVKEAYAKWTKSGRDEPSAEVDKYRKMLCRDGARLIAQDPSLAEVNEVQTAIWRYGFYKLIEHYRGLLAKGKTKRRTSTDAPKRKNRGLGCNASKAKKWAAGRLVNELFKGKQFYTKLSEALRTQARQRKSDAVVWRLYKEHISRTYIFMGDLERYRELYNRSGSKTWDKAKLWYEMAIGLVPSNGAAHNQLAVVAMYTKQECVAAYQYTRSLMVSDPFKTAEMNLKNVYKKNKKYCAQLPWSDPRGWGRPVKVAEKKATRNAFLARFVRFHGIVFNSESSLQELGQIYMYTSAVFPSLLRMSMLSKDQMVALVVLCIVSLIRLDDEFDAETDQKLHFARAMLFSVISNYCLEANVQIVPAHASRAAAHNFALSRQLIAGVNVFCDWAETCPELLHEDGVDDANAKTALPKGARECEMNARRHMWTAIAGLLNRTRDLALQYASSIESKSTGGKSPKIPVLWEQVHLRGFKPLARAYGSVKYRKKLKKQTSRVVMAYRAHKLHTFARWAISAAPRNLFLYSNCRFSTKMPTEVQGGSQILIPSEDYNGVTNDIVDPGSDSDDAALCLHPGEEESDEDDDDDEEILLVAKDIAISDEDSNDYVPLPSVDFLYRGIFGYNC